MEQRAKSATLNTKLGTTSCELRVTSLTLNNESVKGRTGTEYCDCKLRLQHPLRHSVVRASGIPRPPRKWGQRRSAASKIQQHGITATPQHRTASYC